MNNYTCQQVCAIWLCTFIICRPDICFLVISLIQKQCYKLDKKVIHLSFYFLSKNAKKSNGFFFKNLQEGVEDIFLNIHRKGKGHFCLKGVSFVSSFCILLCFKNVLRIQFEKRKFYILIDISWNETENEFLHPKRIKREEK